MKTYETTVILDPQLENNIIDENIKKIENYLKDSSGEILSLQKIGNRKLAYDIRKRDNGYYLFIQFKSASNIVKSLENQLRLNEAVLRYLTVLSNRKPNEIAYKTTTYNQAADEEE